MNTVKIQTQMEQRKTARIATEGMNSREFAEILTPARRY